MYIELKEWKNITNLINFLSNQSTIKTIIGFLSQTKSKIVDDNDDQRIHIIMHRGCSWGRRKSPRLMSRLESCCKPGSPFRFAKIPRSEIHSETTATARSYISKIVPFLSSCFSLCFSLSLSLTPSLLFLSLSNTLQNVLYRVVLQIPYSPTFLVCFLPWVFENWSCHFSFSK